MLSTHDPYLRRYIRHTKGMMTFGAPQPIPSTFLEFAPALLVEILSPHDRPGEPTTTRCHPERAL